MMQQTQTYMFKDGSTQRYKVVGIAGNNLRVQQQLGIPSAPDGSI